MSETKIAIIAGITTLATSIAAWVMGGTAALSPQDVWDYLLSNINTPNSIGERLKNAATVDSTGSQIANLT
jgi:hypothetical protein